jgi:hypothetical protein
VAEPSEPLVFTLRAGGDDEIDTGGVVVTVDGVDVTARCEFRVPRRWPANRADVAYRPASGWAAGEHRVTVSWARGSKARTWEFEAG